MNDGPQPSPSPKGDAKSVNSAGTNTVLEAKNFSISLGGKQVLRDVSFSLRRGEYVAVVGPNGAGKTTML